MSGEATYPGSESERFWEYARSALSLMQESGIVPNPQNYEVWYVYLSRENPELVKSVEAHIDRGGKITADLSEKLYHSLISHETFAKSVTLVSDMMAAEVNKVVGNLGEFTNDANSYGNALEGFRTLLEEEVGRDVLNQVREKMLSATKKTVTRIAALETGLEDAQSEINKLNHYLETIRQEANTDSLTGLFTRKRFDQALVENIRRAAENEYPLTVLMSDIDMYSTLKEKWGQMSVDQILKLVSGCIKENIKGRDLASRYSGEVFAVLLPKTDVNGATVLANQVRSTVEKKRIVRKNTGEFLGRVTVSIGLAQYKPSETIASFMGRVDRALQRAKSSGGNTSLCIDNEGEGNHGGEGVNVA